MTSLLPTSRRHDISITSKGEISIAAHVARTLDLKHGDVIDFGVNDGDLFLYVRHRGPTVGRHRGAVFQTKKGSLNFRLQSQQIAKILLQHLKTDDKKVLLNVGEPLQVAHIGTAIPIITQGFKTK